MKKKLLILDEKIFNDVKSRYAGGVYKNASNSLFLRLILEQIQNKLNKR